MRGMMKRKYFEAKKCCEKRALAWDYYLAKSGGFIDGYNKAKEDAILAIKNGENLNVLGDEEVELVQEDGMHQLTARCFYEWEKNNKAMSFPEALKTYLDFFTITDIRVHEDKGTISFQGTAKRGK